MSDVYSEIRNLLTRAADLEARRQDARTRGDRQAEHAAEAELRQLWRRYEDLERQERIA